jgi:hypothetical protein
MNSYLRKMGIFDIFKKRKRIDFIQPSTSSSEFHYHSSHPLNPTYEETKKKLQKQEQEYLENGYDIDTPSELANIINNKQISYDIIIRGKKISTLIGIEKINGTLGISDSTLKNLGTLKEITGDLWIYGVSVPSKLTSLNNLELIGGDANFRYSNIKDLGNLLKVEGKLSLRDTNIKSLGKIKFIGGDLFLPKRLEGNIDLSEIEIIGNVKYWNNKRETEELNPIDFMLIEEMAEKELLKGSKTINEQHIYYHAGYSILTSFGKKHIDEVRKFTIKQVKNYMKNKEGSFFELFYKTDLDKNRITPYSFKHYKDYYLNEKEYEHYYELDNNSYNGGYVYHVVQNAIKNQFRVILKGAEDLYRESIGMPKIGEGWISETELYYKIANAFPDFVVKQHGSPKWLGKQHLDIYFPDLNIAIEYQGAQHYIAVDFFGGGEALVKNLERDARKKQLCSKNDCHFIIVDEGYEFEVVRKNIQQAIDK